MWFEDQVLFPRFIRSLFWTIVIQESYLSLSFLFLRIITWNPVMGFLDWLFYLIHWKTLVYRCVLWLTTVAFGVLNRHFYSAEKHICSSRLEKISRALSPRHIQHFIITMLLGGLASHCCIKLFQIFDPEKQSFLSSFLILEQDFEHMFVVQHGCYTAIMLNLKYFICYLYIVKFHVNQVNKMLQIKSQAFDVFKDSVICVLKGLHWFYMMSVFLGLSLENQLISFGLISSESDSYFNFLHSLINLKLFLVTFITGVIIFFNWSLYLIIFNTFVSERHIFPIEMPVQSDKNQSLSAALRNSEFDVLKYLAVLDLRLLSQHDVERRKQIYTISHPGGHPHQWKAVAEFCISSLKQYLSCLQEYSRVAAAMKEPKLNYNKGVSFILEEQKSFFETSKELPTFSKTIISSLRGWPAVAYFLDEFPSTKIRKLFASSQPLMWMIDALGYLVSAAYSEDKFGVIQQTLPEIIRLLLDIKMAEEKLPIDLVGFRTHVKDPYGRYDHIHQRVSLKTSVNAALCRIADTFKNDINGIYLPEEYLRYFQRYLNRWNA